MINITSKIPIIGIYKITSPSNKIYIGQAVDIQRRWDYYKWGDNSFQIKLNRSFLKYGVENHTFEIIEECPEDRLDELEAWWKYFYGVQCVEEGLNFYYIDKKGRLGLKDSEETRKKKSRALKGRKCSEETIEKIKLTRKRKIVNQLDLEGNFIKEWPSTLEIERILKIPNDYISLCCRGKIKKSQGFIWKYKE